MNDTNRDPTSEPWQLNAVEQVSLVSSGRLTCRQLVESHVGRIRALNNQLGAVTVMLEETALAAADKADRASCRGALHGLPFTVKEDIDCLGSPTTHGVPALRDAFPYEDAPIVARLRAAGAIPIGRTNLSEMGLRLCTTNPLHGRTFSPYDRRLTVGGSSGGDAVAVVTGMTPVGIGGDLGGSLRVPAACCGCAALKPTSGLIPHAYSLEPRDNGLAMQLMFSVGLLTRSAQDLGLLLPNVAGRDLRDPRSVNVPLQGQYQQELTAAIVTSIPGITIESGATNAVRRAGALLKSAGWQVEEATPPEVPKVAEVFATLLAAELEAMAHRAQPILSDAVLSHVQRLCGSSAAHRLHYPTLHAERSRLIRVWSGFFSEYSVVVGPNLVRPIWQIDSDLDADTGIALIDEATRFLAPGNALGIPSLTLPTGVVNGRPRGVVIYADLWREDTCVKAAMAIEAGLAVNRPIAPQWS